jgi:hypothetical protein
MSKHRSYTKQLEVTQHALTPLKQQTMNKQLTSAVSLTESQMATLISILSKYRTKGCYKAAAVHHTKHTQSELSRGLSLCTMTCRGITAHTSPYTISESYKATSITWRNPLTLLWILPAVLCNQFLSCFQCWPVTDPNHVGPGCYLQSTPMLF